MASVQYMSYKTNKMKNPYDSENNTYSPKMNLMHHEASNLSPLQKLQINYQQKLMAEKQEKMIKLYNNARNNSSENIYRKSSKDTKKFFATSGNSNYATVFQPQKHELNNGRSEKSYSEPLIEKNVRSKRNVLPPIATKRGLLDQLPEDYYENFSGKTNEKNQTPFDDESPPPNPIHLRNLHRKKVVQTKKLGAQKHHYAQNTFENEKHDHRLTNFQKFQIQQSKERENRLKRHMELQKQKSEPHVNYDFNRNENEAFLTSANAATSTRYRRQKLNLLAQIKTPPRHHSASPSFVSPRSKGFQQKQNLRQKMHEDEIQKLMNELEQKKRELEQMQKANDLDSSSDFEESIENNFKENEIHDIPVPEKFRVKPVLVRRGRSSSSRTSSSRSISNKQIELKHNITHEKEMAPILSEEAIKPEESMSIHKQEKYNKKLKHLKPLKHRSKQSPFPGQLSNNQSYILYSDNDSKQNAFNIPAATHTNNIGLSKQTLGNEVVSEQPDEVVRLVECQVCHRKFNEARIAKHIDICSVSHNKKRKTYDMSKARTEGTEMENFKPKPPKRRQPIQSTKSNWREKHNEFIKTIRDAKKFQEHIAKGGKASDLPPPPPSKNDDYIQCQHCGRRFNQTAAERHIPKCKDIKAKPKFLKKQSRR